MKIKNRKNQSKLIVKTCLFCRKIFYAKLDTAKYCCDSHKVQYNKWVKTADFDRDPNEGKALSPGTITNPQIPEDKLIFQGNKDSLYRKLLEIMSAEDLIHEKEYIEKLIPFSSVKDWSKSITQVFTDKDFMEVMRISPKEYKLYKEPSQGYIKKIP
jgi:hypothetical protein